MKKIGRREDFTTGPKRSVSNRDLMFLSYLILKEFKKKKFVPLNTILEMSPYGRRGKRKFAKYLSRNRSLFEIRYGDHNQKSYRMTKDGRKMLKGIVSSCMKR